MNAANGSWGSVFNTTIMGIHQVLLGDGRVLYWGDDGAGNAFSNTQQFGIYNPETGEHEVVSESFAVKMFCGAGVLIPGTDQVLIGGGFDQGQNDGKLFDTSDESLTFDAQFQMSWDRFYPTAISLSTGQVVILGGKAGTGVGTPEIFTVGQGWHKLEGATDPDVAANWWYPDAWVNNKGEIVYIAVGAGNQNDGTNAAGTFEIMALDPVGDGSIRQIGEVPFQMDVRSTAAMYDVGKIVLMDHTGDLWYMDINGETPEFSFAADLPTDRENGDMTVLPDGRILINGGTTTGNSQNINNAVLQSVVFDPFSGEVSFVDAESVMRLYHSSSILLPDGTVMSMGGGGLGGTLNFHDAQIYRPDYLFNDDGSPADRPQVTSAPETVRPGEAFTIEVDDAALIARLSFVKTGAVTHSTNMDSGRMDLDFTVLSGTQIEVNLPENPHVLGAGNWMLFAIDTDGVPSTAPIISVEPTLEPFNFQDGSLEADYFILNAGISSLSQIDFNQATDHSESVNIINLNTTHGSGFIGGPADNFAARYAGGFETQQTGTYTFYLKSNDGSQLFINGQLLINNDGMHSVREFTQSINLSAGIHNIEVRYFEAGGSAVLDLDWAGPGFGRQQMMFEDIQEPLLSVSAPADVQEGNAGETGSLIFTVTLDRASAEDITADILLSGNVTGPTNVTIAAGQTTVGIELFFNGDNAVDGDETITVTLANLTGASGGSLTASAVILDDDPQPGGEIIFTESDDIFDARGQTGPVSLFGLGGNDTLGGSDVGDAIDGGAGNDTLNGNDGDDRIFGRSGRDTINGGDGVDEIFGGGSSDTISGGRGADILEGNADSDLISGGDSNDSIKGGTGRDEIHGDAGNDVVFGGGGSDRIFGGAGSDSLNGGGLNDVIEGGDDNDRLTGGAGDDILSGDAGDDVIIGMTGNDTVNGGTGNDTLSGNVGDDTISGDDGDDTIFGNAGFDTIFGGAGDDTIQGGGNRDTLNGGLGNDIIIGGAGSDQIFGGAGADVLVGGGLNDTINGGDGNDQITGGGGDDQVHGDAGNDVIIAMSGNDIITGGAGNDELNGNKGDDILNGGAGNDNLIGGDGNDVLDGGSGIDVLQTGEGADIVIFRQGDGRATVTDFQNDQDTLDLSGFGFSSISEATILMTEADGAVTFALNGDTLVIQSTSIADLADDILL